MLHQLGENGTHCKQNKQTKKTKKQKTPQKHLMFPKLTRLIPIIYSLSNYFAVHYSPVCCLCRSRTAWCIAIVAGVECSQLCSRGALMLQLKCIAAQKRQTEDGEGNLCFCSFIQCLFFPSWHKAALCFSYMKRLSVHSAQMSHFQEDIVTSLKMMQ